eukprot:1307732-Ditylum_brightwellii.AAC.1
MEESSASVLMAEMNNSASVVNVKGETKKRSSNDEIIYFDNNKILHNKNPKDIYLLGCESLTKSKSKLNTHFISYFEIEM